MRALTKRGISIVLILFLLYLITTTFNFMKTAEGTIMQISIKTNFDIKDIKELVVEVTQYNPEKVNVELDKSNANEVIIRTSLMDENAYEKFILVLQENYGEDIEVLMLTNFSTTVNSKNRQMILIIISIALIVIITTLLTCDELKRRRIN